MRRKRYILTSFALFALAGALLTYPLVSIHINNKYHSDVETTYAAAIKGTDNAELTAQREAAEQYNAMLSGAAQTTFGI